jgi:hypothetical protein
LCQIILGLRENPNILGPDDVEIVRDDIPQVHPFARQHDFKESGNGFDKFIERLMVLVMRHGFMHDTPQSIDAGYKLKN